MAGSVLWRILLVCIALHIDHWSGGSDLIENEQKSEERKKQWEKLQ